MPGFGWLEIHAVDHCNNNCKYCNNNSPRAKAREYAAEECLPHLDLLRDQGVNYYCISILGGEPFLHKDLTAFTRPLRQYEKSLMLTTNGFWLSPEKIEAYAELFELVDILCFSLYPSMIERYFESRDQMVALIDGIATQYPHLRVDKRNVSKFYAFDFLDRAVAVDRFCQASDCVALLADGRMGRCNIGTWAHLDPGATPEFLDNQDMFYDLKSFSADDFWMWRKRWPMDACAYCTNFRSELVEWEYESRIPPRRR